MSGMDAIRGVSPHILVVGDVILDHYIVGASERVSPEAPVPVVEVRDERFSLGGAANVASNLRALGAQVTLASVIGADDTGQQVLHLLRDQGTDASAVVIDRGRETTRKSRVVVQNHQVVRLDRESRHALRPDTEQAICHALHLDLETCSYDLVLISDYAKGCMTPSLCQTIIGWCRERGIKVLVDPKGTDGEKYRGATLVTPNRREASQLAGFAIADDPSLAEAGERLRRQLDLDFAVITLSEQGMAVFDGRMIRLPTSAKEVCDVSGAGDTVLAALGFGMACGLTVVDAASLANDAAAVVVSKLGTATANWDEIVQHRRRGISLPERGVLGSLTELDAAVHAARRYGQRIVFTNGCFDLVHRGHVEYLSASKQCGDLLIVAVNSDNSVRRLKGPTRPVLSEQDRSSIIAALHAVDYVVIFDEDTPYELIRRIGPDVLTKGAEYRIDQVVGADLVADVRLIEWWEGRSTSSTIRRIQQAA